MNKIICLIIVAFSILGSAFAESLTNSTEVFAKGVVIQVISEVNVNNPLDDPLEPDRSDKLVQQRLKIQITSGQYEKEIIDIDNTASTTNNTYGTYYLRKGDKVLLLMNIDGEGMIQSAYVQDMARDFIIYGLMGAFAFILLVLGGKRGFFSLISLGSIALLIWFGLIPYVKNGGSAIAGAIVVCMIVTIVTIPLVHGANIKSFASVLGTFVGVTIAGAIGIWVSQLGTIIGVEFEFVNILSTLPRTVPFNYQGIFLAGVLIGALGAVMDTCISVASAIQEIYELHPKITRKQLWKTGMNVGKDVMSMMSSTLILAYTGSAISLLLILSIYTTNPLVILNSDMFVSEVIRMLSGSIGLSLAIPVTILVAIQMVEMTRRE